MASTAPAVSSMFLKTTGARHEGYILKTLNEDKHQNKGQPYWLDNSASAVERGKHAHLISSAVRSLSASLDSWRTELPTTTALNRPPT
ncbi:MAG: hypothetical protein FRX49_12810 [Trebouxia sp. A1-2]|nr:MAG: hypothetical protein FRX49_12810 [Trebouxia sp. A1-2]